MAQNSPASKENQEVQFKVHDKFQIFSSTGSFKNNVNLLAVSITHGLLFAGDPNAPILKVFILNELVAAKNVGSSILVRTVQLAGEPNVVACSCDGTMIAVNYTNNGCDYLQIFNVSSFLKQNIETLYSFPIAPEAGVTALQLLWNPVISASIGIVSSDGGFSLYTLKGNGQYELHSLDKSQQVQCGCWSPKGKQIVLGFHNGKLQQFKPDLTPAKTIACPANVHPGPFSTIAVQWLSTYQFAVAFLQSGEDTVPSLYIVNAPKNAQPTYVNYYDVCYTSTGLRDHQVIFTHIQQWSLLLVTAANGVEVGVLGCKEPGDTPPWVQYMPIDEARIEMPLTDTNDETYPIGFVYDTSSSHNVLMGDLELPTMPMVHVLSTHGQLISFNFLNLAADAASVCSPPPPISSVPSSFQALEVNNASATAAGATPAEYSEQTTAAPVATTITPKIVESSSDKNLNKGEPLQQPTKPLIFADKSGAAKPNAFANSFGMGAGLTFGSGISGAASQASGSASVLANTLSSFGIGKPQSEQTQIKQPQQQPQQIAAAAPLKPTEVNKPLYTVPPTFAPPQSQQFAPTQEASTTRKPLQSREMELGLMELINIDMNMFEKEIRLLASKAQHLFKSIGNPVEMNEASKKLSDLQEIIEQANDRELEADVKDLHNSINECRSMIKECRWKLKKYENPDLPRLASSLASETANQRHLARLQAYLSENKMQMQCVQLLIDSQWSMFQDTVRRNTKSQLHIPCLDGIYQRMSKVKELISRHRTRLNYIRSKLKENGLTYKSNAGGSAALNASNAGERTMESLVDSVLSMSLIHTVQGNRSKLSDDKLNAIRNFTRQRQKINIIKPQRPDRVGLKSEVVLETYLRSERKKPMETKSTTTPSTATSSKAPLIVTKPMPATSEPVIAAKPTVASSPFAAPLSKPLPTATSTAFAKSTESAAKPAFSFSQTGFSGFANLSTQPSPFGQTKPSTDALKFSSASLTATATPPIQTPISFAAKVIGGESAKAAAPLSAAAGLNTPAFTGFSAAATVKPAAVDKENKKPEEPVKSFNFSTNTPFSSAAPKTTSPTAAVSSTKPTAVSESKAPFSFSNLAVTTPTPQNNAAAGPAKTGNATVSFQKPAVLSEKQTADSTSSGAEISRSSSGFFSGFGKPVGEASSTVLTASNESVSFQTISSAASNAAPTKSEDSTTKPPPLEKPTPVVSKESNAESTNSVFGSLNICKPNTKPSDSKAAPANIFSGLGTTTAQPVDFSFTSTSLGTPTSTAKTESSPAGFSFGATPKLTTSTAPLLPAPTTTAAASSLTMPVITKVTSAATEAIDLKTTSETSEAKPAQPAAVVPEQSTQASAAPTPANFTFSLSGLGIAPTSTAPPASASSIFGGKDTLPTAAETGIFGAGAAAIKTPTTTTAAVSPGTSIFGGGASSFGSTAATGSLFVSTAPATTAPSIFGGTPAAPVATVASPFGAAVTSPPNANLFSSLPKPDQSVFGSATTAAASPPSGASIFGATSATPAAPANTSPFGTPAGTATGGSIFGGGATSPTAFGKPAGGSIFGGSATAPTSPFGGSSIFGGAAKPAEPTTNIFGASTATGDQSANVFGSPATQGQATGSIFGQSSLGQQQSPFGGGGGGAGTSAGGSIFGAAANTSNTTGSIFGGGSPLAPSAFGSSATTGGGSGGFGGFSQPSAGSAFGSPSGGSFAQGGSSVAATGFGSPQASAFGAKPVFGAAPAFGGQPAFGAAPTFGGAATFGSPKGFGSFSGASPTTSPTSGNMFGQPIQKNNLFESLGASDTGLSFGNLAQSANANAQKPAFGGTSFTSYRA